MDIVPGRLFLASMDKKKNKPIKHNKTKKEKQSQQDKPTPTRNGTSPSSHILTKHPHHFTGGVTLHLKWDPSHRHSFSPSSPFLIQTSCPYTTALRLILASRTTLRPTPPGPHRTTNIRSPPRPSFPTRGAWFRPAAPPLGAIALSRSLRRRSGPRPQVQPTRPSLNLPSVHLGSAGKTTLTAEAIEVQGTKISSKHTGRTDKYSSTLIYTILHSHLFI